MGGAKVHTRGIDEEGNAGNCVEIEQLVYNHKVKDTKRRIRLTSYV